MWHTFSELPFVVRVVAWGTVGFVTLITMIKARAIHAALKAAWDTVSERFWRALRKKLAVESHVSSNRTYKGTFVDHWYASTPHDAWFFSLSDNGVITTVPVLDTSLLATLKRGTTVQIDTEVLRGVEIVQRVRVYRTPA